MNNIGNATEYRTLEILNRIGVHPAPSGYEWINLPGGYGSWGDCTRALGCLQCGAAVVIHEAHTAWHVSA